MWKIWVINAEGDEFLYCTEYETEREAKAALKEKLDGNSYIEGSLIISGRIEKF